MMVVVVNGGYGGGDGGIWLDLDCFLG